MIPRNDAAPHNILSIQGDLRAERRKKGNAQ
jgi:hypothetical protein